MPNQHTVTDPEPTTKPHPPEVIQGTEAGHSNPRPTTPRSNLSRIIQRLARIWSGVVILVGLLLITGEVFASRSPSLNSYPAYENIIPLALLISLLGLALAWKWEVSGGVFAVLGVFVANAVYWVTGREARLIVFFVTLPVLIPGLLFLISGWLNKKPAVSAEAGS